MIDATHKNYIALSGLILLWLYMLWVSYALYQNPLDSNMIQYANLVFHEAGHAFLYWLPGLPYVLGGTLLEIGVPLGLCIYFGSTQPIARLFCLWWTGTALWSVGTYAADALVQKLPLIGGDKSGHDWTYIMAETPLRVLEPEFVGGTMYLLGSICIAWAMVSFALYLIHSLTPHYVT